MEKIVLASNNKHKIKEFKEILNDKEILTLNDIGFYNEIEENGNTLEDNSLIKAKAVNDFLKEKNLAYDILADDTGLFCEALGDKPGVFSARYASDHDDALNRKKLIQDLEDKEVKDAYFKCIIILYHPDNSYNLYEGRTYGTIIDEERGNTSFGYDAIFFSQELGKTFGEASSEEKNSVSHRGRALEKLREDLL